MMISSTGRSKALPCSPSTRARFAPARAARWCRNRSTTNSWNEPSGVQVRTRDSGRSGMDELLSRLSGACCVWRLQAVRYWSRKPQDDARPLSEYEERSGELFDQGAGLLLKLVLSAGAGITRVCVILMEELRMVNRVEITEKAAEVLARLKVQHGALMFHQSGGCCDGLSPMCYPVGDFRVGPQDVLLGEIA